MFTFIVFCLFIVTEVCYLLNIIFAIINYLSKFAL